MVLRFQNNCSARNAAASPTKPDLPVKVPAQAAQLEEDCPTAPYHGDRPLGANSYGGTQIDLARDSTGSPSTVAGGGGSSRGNNDNQVFPRVAAAGASALVAARASSLGAAGASTAEFSCLLLTLEPNQHFTRACCAHRLVPVSLRRQRGG